MCAAVAREGGGKLGLYILGCAAHEGVFLVLQEVWLDQEDVLLLKEGEEVTLMDWGNAIVHTICKSPDGKTITGEETLCSTFALTGCAAPCACILDRMP